MSCAVYCGKGGLKFAGVLFAVGHASGRPDWLGDHAVIFFSPLEVIQ